MCYATKYINQLEQLVRDIKGKHKELGKKLSAIDKQVNVFYHDLEQRPAFNAVEGYYIAKDLQLLLQQRRVIKSELLRLHTMIKSLEINHVRSKLPKTIKNVNELVETNSRYETNFKEEAYMVLH
ncbi:hypothetical protein P4V41_07540 [Fictibacillus nanhaiensis]|uniref:hypothetical protein n=1 Tax=Fictibacillus nanhaiensis TaxID=742169 RepID=UPI002E2435C2|nr:hypothetical protein [Fictibacillus nanhaiensis]